MDSAVQQALQDFTTRFCQAWNDHGGSLPASRELAGIASPCISQTVGETVYWQPRPFTLTADLSAVERALDISIRPEAHAFYTTQFAGDMPGCWEGLNFTFLQPWSEDDFTRVQENLIGHLVTQKRLRLSPTLFIATLDSETEIIALCNVTGEVIVETLGRRERRILAPGLAYFLLKAVPRVE